MVDPAAVPPPVACRCLLAIASAFVPRDYRTGWRNRWTSRLRNLLVLIDRGEIAGDPVPQMAWLCRAACIDAFWTRVHRPSLRQWSLGGSFVICCALALLTLIGFLSHGFQVTRWLAAAPFQAVRGPRAPNPLFLYLFPIVTAIISGAVVVGLRRPAWHRYGWRYWTFLGIKTSLLAAISWLLWIEGGAALRARLHPEGLRIIVGGLLCSLLLIAAFCRAMAWSVADQRVRCPVCLQRLAMPVSLGSRSSVLDPAKTELLCRAGHGSLCLSDSDEGASDRWTALDVSWQPFFEETSNVR